MIGKISKYIDKYNMLDNCRQVVVGLSGGADSVCLLLVLHSIIEQRNLDIELLAVHVNHGIRGDEADRDEAFARDLCLKLGVKFECVHTDVPKMAADTGMSEEEAGRTARYAAFGRFASTDGRIAVAHHMDDQAETVLMNLFRGSGMKGMGGMSPVRDNIIRPLLCVTRLEIETFLKMNSQDYVTDSTNASNEYTRNKIRNELLPYITANLNNEAVKHIVEAAEEVAGGFKCVEKLADEAQKKCVSVSLCKSKAVVNLDLFGDLDITVKAQVIKNILDNIATEQRDIYKVHVESVLALEYMEVGKQISLPYNIIARKGYNDIEIYKKCRDEEKEKRNSIMKISVPDMTAQGQQYTVWINEPVYDGDALRLLNTVVFRVMSGENFNKNNFDKKNNYTKFFDYDKMKDNLYLRYREIGDFIAVDCQGSSKKLKEEFINRKIPKDMRENVLLLASDNVVFWAVGVRTCENCRVDDYTLNILEVSLHFENEV